jgi:hypothetical protein
MSDVIQRLREGRPEAAGPHDEVVASARAALMAQVTRGRPTRRWHQRRVLRLAAPALAAGIGAIVLGITVAGGDDEPARAAAVVRVAEKAPRILVDDAGWRVAYVGRFSLDYGEITLAASGRRRLKVYWLPAKELEPALQEGRAKLESLGAARAVNTRATLFRVPGTDDYVAVWRQEEYMVEAQGRAPNEAAFRVMLASLREVGAERWLSAMPKRLRVRPAMPHVPVGNAPPAVDEMAVFARPAEEADTLPPRFHYRLESSLRPCPALGPPIWGCIGEQLAIESRLLLSGLGEREVKLYAWPTTEGYVCWGLNTVGGGCTPDFELNKPRAAFLGSDPDSGGEGAPGAIIGIVPDDVVAVDVVVSGNRRPATFGNNGFYYELSSGACGMASFDRIIVTHRDGSVGSASLDYWQNAPRREGKPPPTLCGG